MAGGVEAGIEGTIHAARLQWAQHSDEEDWGFLLIDARKKSLQQEWAVVQRVTPGRHHGRLGVGGGRTSLRGSGARGD